MLAEVERPYKSLDPDSPLERKPLHHIKIDRCFLHWSRASATSLFYNYSQRGSARRRGMENRADKRETKPWLQEDRQQAAETHLDISLVKNTILNRQRN